MRSTLSFSFDKNCFIELKCIWADLCRSYLQEKLFVLPVIGINFYFKFFLFSYISCIIILFRALYPLSPKSWLRHCTSSVYITVDWSRELITHKLNKLIKIQSITTILIRVLRNAPRPFDQILSPTMLHYPPSVLP